MPSARARVSICLPVATSQNLDTIKASPYGTLLQRYTATYVFHLSLSVDLSRVFIRLQEMGSALSNSKDNDRRSQCRPEVNRQGS